MRKTVDNHPFRAYHTANPKPLRKRSNRQSEGDKGSREQWDHGAQLDGEWPSEGGGESVCH